MLVVVVVVSLSTFNFVISIIKLIGMVKYFKSAGITIINNKKKKN